MHTHKPLSWNNPKNLSGRSLFVKKKKKKTQIMVQSLRIEFTKDRTFLKKKKKDRTFFYQSRMPYFFTWSKNSMQY